MLRLMQKYAPVLLVFSIAFLMINVVTVQEASAAVPSTMSVSGNAITVTSFDDRRVSLSWTAPSANPVLTDYQIDVGQNSDCATNIVTYSDPISTLTLASVYNLTPNTTYYFAVSGVNADGTGTRSDCVEQKTLGQAANFNYQGQGQQNFNAGHSFGEGTQFEPGQSFSGGVMTFGANQHFGEGTEFAAGQSFSGGIQNFTGAQTFGSGSTFAANQTFDAGQKFDTGTQNFGSGTHFHGDVEFSNSQEFSSGMTFGAGATFGASTTFGAVQTFNDNMDFSAGTHTFSAAQQFTNGSSFGANQSFGAGQSHNFFADDLAFLAGVDFGASRTFGEGFTATGTQNWDDEVHVFGKDPFFNGNVNFADNQVFPEGASFAAGQDFESGESYTFGAYMDFGGGETFAAARDFAAGTVFSASSDVGSFTNTFGAGAKMPPAQAYAALQTFSEHMHFGDNSDFSAMAQTFKAGAHFGDGTTFAVGQSMPAATVPPFGLMLSAFECLDAACVPSDADAYLAPGEFLTPGVDPDPVKSSITKDTKTIEMDGLGFAMEFNGTVSTPGTVSIDPIDPATLVGSTEVTETPGARSITTDLDGSFETVGTILDITMDTAVATGSMDITVEYDESNIPGGAGEDTLEVLHHVGGSWITQDTCTQDTTNNKFTCTLASLSPVGVGSSAKSSSSSSAGGCAACKVLRTTGGFAIDDQTYTLVKKYNDIDINEVKTGEPVTITLSVDNAKGIPRLTSAIIYMDVYGSPNNYKQSSSISFSPNAVDKIAVNDRVGLWSSTDVDRMVVNHPHHETFYRMNYEFTMIFDKPMDTSHIVIETTNHYGIPEVLYVLDAIKVVENEGNYTDEVDLQEESEPEVVLQSTPEPEAVIEPQLINDPEPVFMSEVITSSIELVLDPEPIPIVSAEPEQDMVSELAIDTEPVLKSEPKQTDFFSWLASLFS